MDNGPSGKRVKGLTNDTSNVLHMTLLGMIDLIKTLLLQGREYVLITGHLQSDRIEAEFGIYRGNSGGNLHISVEQVISSLKLERIKLFSKIDVPLEDEAGIENVCCDLNLEQRDDDIEALSNCYAASANLPALEINISLLCLRLCCPQGKTVHRFFSLPS